jgi:TPR repeat protein
MNQSKLLRFAAALAVAVPATMVPAPAYANPSISEALSAARNGDSRAAYIAGMMLMFGQGTRQNITEGARWLDQSARAGLLQAMVSLAALYDLGQGVPLDRERAASLRQQAARAGDPTARGQIDDDRRMPGQADFRRASVLTDLHMESAAIPYARRAAAQGSANAQLVLGRAYQFGSGVPRDFAQAVQFYRQAATSGMPEGARHLAYMYEFGLGVRVDRRQALVYYDRAAAGGLSKARQAAANLRSPDYDQRPSAPGGSASGNTNGSSNSKIDYCENRGGTTDVNNNCQVYHSDGYQRIDPNTGQPQPQ